MLHRAVIKHRTEIAARSVAIEVTTASIAELETLKAERAAELHTEQLRLEECRASCVEEKAGLLAAVARPLLSIDGRDLVCVDDRLGR